MSSIPAAVDKLVELFAAALSIEVSDGPPIVEFEQDGLSVGWMPDQLSVQMREKDSSLNDRGESYDIKSFLWARTGDEEVKPVRDRIFGYLKTIRTTLKENKDLGGAVTRATVQLVDFDQGQTSEGAWATMMLSIHCETL